MCAHKTSLICTSETSSVCLVHLVGLVYLVDLVHLVYPVSLVQANKRDKPHKPNNDLLALADFFSILLIAYLDEQVVGSQPILSDTGPRIEREMSGGVCDWLELVCQRQGLRIDE
jgi:hypothetical protein